MIIKLHQVKTNINRNGYICITDKMKSLRRIVILGIWRWSRSGWQKTAVPFFILFMFAIFITTRNMEERTREEIMKILDDKNYPMNKSDITFGISSVAPPKVKIESPSSIREEGSKYHEENDETDKSNENLKFGFVNEEFEAEDEKKGFLQLLLSDPDEFQSEIKNTPFFKNVGVLLKYGVALRNKSIEVMQEKAKKDADTVKPKTVNLNPQIRKSGAENLEQIKQNKVQILDPQIKKDPSLQLEARKGKAFVMSKNDIPPINDIRHEAPEILNIDQSKMIEHENKNRRPVSHYSEAKNPDELLEKKEAIEREKTGSSFMGNLVKQLGPALVSSALLNKVSTSDNDNPLLSLAGNMLPHVINSYMKPNDQSADNNPMSSIISGLGNMAILAMKPKEDERKSYVLQNNQDHPNQPSRPNSRNMKPEGPNIMDTIQNVAGQVGPLLLSSALSGNNDNNKGLVGQILPVLMNSYLQPQGIRSKRGGDDPKVTFMGEAAKWALGKVVDSIPNEIDVDAEPFSKGIMTGVMKYGIGDLTQNTTQNSKMLKWLRGGLPTSNGTQTILPRLAKALFNPMRERKKKEIEKFYKSITEVQDICHQVDSVGGLYNWKTDTYEKRQQVCKDKDVSMDVNECRVLSFGIRNEWSFEEQMQKTGCKVWAFDPSMQTGNHNHSAGIEFYNVGLDVYNRTKHIKEQVWTLFTYSTILGHLGIRGLPIYYLKIDLPAGEWEILEEILANSPELLSQISQLGVTIHLNRSIVDISLYERYNKVIDVLYRYGFQLFSSIPDPSQSKTFEDPLYPGKNVSLEYKLAYLRL